MSRRLRELAKSYSLLTAYTDAAGKRQVASDGAILGVLRAMGVDIESPRGVEKALRARQQETTDCALEPITVAWNGRVHFSLSLPGSPPDHADWQLFLEDGTVTSGHARLRSGFRVPRSASAASDQPGTRNAEPGTYKIHISRQLPFGYHDLRLRIGKEEYRTRVLSAPKQCYAPGDAQPSWGAFLPIYALSSKRSLGCGDFTDFEELTRFIDSRGGSVVATLPLLATFLDSEGLFEPSPYSPASRLFWNEFYVDVTRAPELERSTGARQMLESENVRNEIAELRNQRYVDYRRQAALKRKILEQLSKTFFESASDIRRREFDQFVQARPAVQDYARFRAATERQQKGWPVWAEPIRSGRLENTDFDPSAARYHLYAQWLTQDQLTHLAENARSAGRGLYLDFPLGVHPDGYDVWHERDAFASSVSVGAPPDPFFTKGQNWGFPPLHPDRIRRQNYDYWIRTLRHHMAHAGILRLDHVMSLHRLYWIPAGAKATEGVYVRYPAAELYAIISIESHRHKTMIVGEDLGTVPGYVRSAMSRHNLRRMYVLQYEAKSDSRSPVNEVVPGSVASLNTHDMPPFGAYWHAADVDSRVEMGLLEEREARQARELRARTRELLAGFLQKRRVLDGNRDDPMAVHDACMTYLSRSEAEVVLVNLEDLWLEKQPQNVPGTSEEKPNWRRKASKTLEEIRSSPSITLRLKTIDLQRRQR